MKKGKNVFVSILVTVLALPMLVSGSLVTNAASDRVNMHRLYNPHSGEHFYTKDSNEHTELIKAGWKSEGFGWVAPDGSSTPVFRLYNKNAGDHHYTTSEGEKDSLVASGWKYEGIAWYSDDSQKVPMYREYNPNAKAGSHNYTSSKAEHDSLVASGWKDEGIGWYAIGEGTSDSRSDSSPGKVETGNLNVGDTWSVLGYWRFKVDSVEKHYACNPANNNYGQVVVINYSYWNDGYKGTYSGLFFDESSFKVYDSRGSLAKTYPCTHTKRYKSINEGESYSASVAYLLEESNGSFKLNIREIIPETFGIKEVTYDLSY